MHLRDAQSPDKVFPVTVVPEDLPTFYPPGHYVMQHVGASSLDSLCMPLSYYFSLYVDYVGNVPYADGILSGKRHILDALAEALIKEEVLVRADVERIIEGSKE